MSNEKVIAQALREYGQALRGDWSDFDGRSARAVLDDFAAELEGNREPHTIEQHRAELGLCPDGNGHWDAPRRGYCEMYECPTYAKEKSEEAAK